MILVPLREVKTSWNPFQDFAKSQNNLNRIFNTHPSMDDGKFGLEEGNWTPAIDVYISHENIMLKADIPGMDKEEIDVTIKDNTLIIKGERKVKEEDYIMTERFNGQFNRTLILPAEVDHSKVKATYKDGVLEIVLSKKEKKKPKQIEISTNN